MIKEFALSNSKRGKLFSFGFRFQIYFAMGSVLTLLGVVAIISLLIISANLQSGREFATNFNLVSKKVDQVSRSIMAILEKEQRSREEFLIRQGNDFISDLKAQRDLYERILMIERSLGDVEKGASRLILEGLRFMEIAAKVDKLAKDLDSFFKYPALEPIDAKLIKRVKRAARGYIAAFEDVKELDEENVSLSQQQELLREAQEVGKTLQSRMTSLLKELKSLQDSGMMQKMSKMKKDLARTKEADQTAIAKIQASQKEVGDTVTDSVSKVNKKSGKEFPHFFTRVVAEVMVPVCAPWGATAPYQYA